MFDIVPLESYTPTYYTLLLVVILFIVLDAYRVQLFSRENLIFKKFIGIFLLVFVILYMGLRPISGRYFVDMGVYASTFQSYQHGGKLVFASDIGFEYFMVICSKTISVNQFFLLCAFLYVFPLYLASKKWFKEYWFYAFLILISSLTFWAYGTNGIRNGIATSLVLLGFAYHDKKIVSIPILVVAALFHQSVLLPIAAYIFTLVYKNSKKIFFFWLLCIPASILAGQYFQNFFGNIGFNDTRLSYLTEGNINNDQFTSTGFRWDFLLYSAIGVFTGWYFILKKGYREVAYARIFNIYLITNGFWILVIKANFSNRFAYLSWFLMGIVIIYPFLKERFFNFQHNVLCNVIFLYFMFTYVLNILLIKS